MKKATWLIILLAGLLQASGFTQTRQSEKKAVKSTHAARKKQPVNSSHTARKKKPVLRKKARRTAKVEYGVASFYSNRFIGKKTANGEIFSQKKLTAAHNSVPLGTYLRVTSLKNKKSVIVKVTDRLHVRNKRIIDLTKAVGQKLGSPGKGLLKVKVEILAQRSY